VYGPQGGGRLIGEACHIVDLFTSFSGSAVQTVSSTRLSPKTDSLHPADNVSVALTYQDGSLGVLDYFALGSRQMPKEHFEIHFDEKSIEVDDYKALRGYGVRVRGLASLASEKGHLQELEAFHRALKTGAWPIPLWDLAQTARVTFSAAGQAGALPAG
jgi:predicted dehydrogenase